MDAASQIHRYLLGKLSEEETAELDRQLAEDPELRNQFILAAATDAGLREVAIERAAEPAAVPQANEASSHHWRTVTVAVLAAGLLLAAGLIFFQATPVATLASSENAAWESELPTTPGSELTPGFLNLKSGVATIEFTSGAELVLEAPAELELVTPMKARLLSGAAVINVPDPATGFVVETPDGYAVDYGTRFAVRVNQQARQSRFELIEGEIAVHHPSTGEELRLKGDTKAATVSGESIVVADLEESEGSDPSKENVIRISTNGRTGSAMRRDEKRHKFIKREFLSVKRTNSGKWDHRSFFSFNLSEADLGQVFAARLRLNLVPSTRGLASRLPKINRFGVYGLTNSEKANWQADCLWNESPGPDDGILLGAFEIPRSQQRGSFGIETEDLLKFLRNNQNETVTLILVRETTQIEGIGPGLTHLFASDSHPESVGPLLELTSP